MAMVVTHNIRALTSNRYLQNAALEGGRSLSRLSSGYRINTGADGPADLVISEKLRAQTAGLERAVRNTQEAMNVLGIAEGALQEMNEILKDLRGLALHAANNGITSPQQVAADQSELDRGIQTIDRVANTTRYSNQFLINGSQSIESVRHKTGPASDSDLLLDLAATHLDMVSGVPGQVLSVQFSALDDAGDYDPSSQASRAYFELSERGGGDVDADGFLTNDVAFTLSTNDGSRRMEFTQGTHVGVIAQAMQNYSGSLGIESSLIFDGTRIPRATSLSAPGGRLINGLGGPAGFGENTFGGNDDGSQFVDLSALMPGGLNFYGTNYTGLWINNNGNVTFNGALATFTPTAITGATGNPIIAPFFADVQTGAATGGPTPGGTSTGTNLVYWDMDAVNGVFTATWNDVGYYANKVDKLNAFQLRIHDQGGGDFDVEIRYEDINWTTGDASGGTAGLGGTVARMGWSSGNGADFQEFSESGIQADVLGLDNSYRYFEVRNGGLQAGESLQDLPSTLAGPTVNNVFGNVANGITGVSGEIIGLEVGHDTDGEGRVWLNVVDDTRYELYSSSSFTDDFRVATGTFGQASRAVNGSNLNGIVLTAGAAVTSLLGSFLSLDGINGRDYNLDYTGILSTGFNSAGSHISGLHLGEHTDFEGKMYVEVKMTGATTGIVSAYRSSNLSSDSLVATTGTEVSLVADTNVILEPVDDTGVGISLTTGNAGITGAAGDSFDGEIVVPDVGVRISAREYGTKHFIQIDQEKGTLWQRYEEGSAELVKEGEFRRETGSNATVVVNGRRVETDGLDLNISTADMAGRLRFLAGPVGEAGVAQVGYATGSIFCGVGAMASQDEDRGGLTHGSAEAGERLTELSGGMRLQLGEGSGTQEGLVLGLQSMVVERLGRTTFRDDFNGDGLKETRTLSLSDLMGGGAASLGTDPVKALTILDAAIEEVSRQRARIGALQANLLETNSNSLQVAVEKITFTESEIRDVDMASQTTAFARNKILQSSATAMLAQANALQQQVLRLLSA